MLWAAVAAFAVIGGATADIVPRWFDLLVAVIAVVLAVVFWRAGLRVDDAGVTRFELGGREVGRWRWEDVTGWDAPKLRYRADPEGGSIRLHLRDGSIVKLPQVGGQPRLVVILRHRLGEPFSGN